MTLYQPQLKFPAYSQTSAFEITGYNFTRDNLSPPGGIFIQNKPNLPTTQIIALIFIISVYNGKN